MFNVVPTDIDSPRAVICGDREVYFFSVQLKDEPGSLAQVLSVIATYGLNIVSIYSSETSSEQRQFIEVNMMLDFTGKPFSVEQVKKSIELLNTVKNVLYSGKQFPNMIFDDFHYPVKLMGDRIIIYREYSYAALIHGIRRQLGTAGEALLYHIGYNIGKGSGQRLKTLLTGHSEFIDKALKYWMLIHSAANISEVQIDPGAKKALIRVADNYECRTGLKTGKPFSNLFRGNLAGILDELFGIETLVETKCIAAGDPYCEFVTPENT